MIILTRNTVLQCCCRTTNDQALLDAKFQYCRTIKQQSLANNNYDIKRFTSRSDIFG